MSGRIPQHFIDDLIARADIAEVIGRRVQLKKKGKEFAGCCPFHDEKTPSFTVVPDKGFYHCFGCGAHGTAIGFLMEHDHLDFVEAVESLAGTMGIEVPREEGQRPVRTYDALFELIGRVSRYFEAEFKKHTPAIEYVKARGIDGATAKRFGLGYAPDGWSHVLDKFGTSKEAVDRLLAVGLIIRKDNGKHYDRFRDRLMFPIRDSRGRVIGFGGRVMGDDTPKYMNSPETVLFHKGRELYGLFESRQAIRHIDRIVVVEGYMDVVGLARHGIDFATATLGTATTPEHLNQLFRLCEEVYFCFDGDRAGRKAAWKALENALPLIREGRQVRFVFLPDGQDPDSFVQHNGAPAFEAALDNALPLSDFLVDELAGQTDMSSVDGRARMAEMARPLLAKIPPGVFKELLVEKVAGVIGLSAGKLTTIVGSDKVPQSNARPAKNQRMSGKPATSGNPSIIRRAITLILHQPAAASGVNVENLSGVSRPGADLLRDLIETAQADPNMTTAGLLERFRNHADGKHLGTLATTEMPASDEFDAGAELDACIHQLAQLARKERLEFLIEKQRLSDLDERERDELRTLSQGSAYGG